MNSKSFLLFLVVTLCAGLSGYGQSPHYDTLTPVVCYDYDLPSGTTVTQSGNNYDTLTNTQGQDSVYYTIQLTVLNQLVKYQWNRQGAKIYGDSVDSYSGNVVDLSADGKTVAISSPKVNNLAGKVRVLRYTNGIWVQMGPDIYGLPDSRFGFEIAISEDGLNVVVGMPGYDHNPGFTNYDHGAFRVYHYSNGQWNMKGNTVIGDLGAFALFGYKVDISADGNFVVVGIPIRNKVKTYKFANGTWTQIGTGISGETTDDDLGISVSCSSNGELIALGSDKNNGAGYQAGHTRVYQLMNGSYWSKVGSDIDGLANTNAGSRVRISPDGSTVAMGSSGNYGYIKVVRWINNDWTVLDTLIQSPYYQDAFTSGLGLSYSGDTLVVGSPGHDANGPSSGMVNVYTLLDGHWAELGDSVVGDTNWDRLGTSTAISHDGQFFTAGAPYSAEGGLDAGWTAIYKVKAYEVPLYSPDTLHVWGCPGTLYTNGGTVMDQAGIYYDSFPNAFGCDSFEYTWFHGDTIAPILNTTNDTIYLDSAGKAIAIVDSLDDGSVDDCTITLSLSKQLYSCSDLGDNQVLIYAYDASGNSDVDGAHITVLDTISPIIEARSDTFVLNATGIATLDPTRLIDSIWDNCNPEMRDTVILYAADASGNVGSDTVVIHLKDITPPVLALSYTILYFDSVGQLSLNIEDLNGTYTDNCQIDSVKFAKGSYDCNDIGLHWDTAYVSDRSGNLSSSPVRIYVGDSTLPWLYAPLKDTNLTYCNSTFSYDVPVMDNCASPTIEQVSGLTSGSIFPIGSTTNRFKVTDRRGNVAYFEFDVTINDRIIPMYDRDTMLCSNGDSISFGVNPSIAWVEHSEILNDSLTLLVADLPLGESSVSIHYDPEPGCTDTFLYSIIIADTPQIPQIVRTSDTSIATDQAYSHYQWYSEGSALPGETDRDLAGMDYGYYTVVVYNSDSCSAQSEEFHFYDNSTIEEVGHALTMYPNPVEDELIIDVTDLPDRGAKLQIQDVSGRVILERNDIAGRVIRVNTTGWASGVYFIRLDQNDVTHSGKIIKVSR